MTRGHRLAKPFDERADFGASQLVGRAIDGEDGGDGLHFSHDFEPVLPERLAGFHEVDDEVGETRERR